MHIGLPGKGWPSGLSTFWHNRRTAVLATSRHSLKDINVQISQEFWNRPLHQCSIPIYHKYPCIKSLSSNGSKWSFCVAPLVTVAQSLMWRSASTQAPTWMDESQTGSWLKSWSTARDLWRYFLVFPNSKGHPNSLGLLSAL